MTFDPVGHSHSHCSECKYNDFAWELDSPWTEPGDAVMVCGLHGMLAPGWVYDEEARQTKLSLQGRRRLRAVATPPHDPRKMTVTASHPHPLMDQYRLRMSKQTLDVLLPRRESLRDPAQLDVLATIERAMPRSNGSRLVWFTTEQLATLEKMATDSAHALTPGPNMTADTSMRSQKSSLQHLARNARLLRPNGE